MAKLHDLTSYRISRNKVDDIVKRVEGTQEILKQIAHIVSVTIQENELILEELKK